MKIGKPIEQVVRTGRAYCFNCEEFTQHDQERWHDRRDDFGTFEKRLECNECEAQHLKEYHPQEKDDTPLFFDMEEKYRTNEDS
jgi:ribosomal protein L44E